MNPLKYVEQHDKQKAASAALLTHMLVALFWGNRVGKTEWGAQTVARVATGEHEVIPPGEIWSFCPSFDEQKDTTQKKLLMYIPEEKILDRTWLRKGILKEIVVDAGQGRTSKISFKSYEQGREKAQGAGKVLIWFDEEPPKEIYEECTVRVDAGVLLRIIMTMTPVKGMTWVYDDIYLKTDNPNNYVSVATWDDNPWLTEEQKQIMASNLTEQALQVRKEGKFIKMVGLVCPWFARDVHVIDMDTLPDGDTWFSLDFGFSAPACGIYARLTRDFDLFVYDGFYETGLTTPMIRDRIKAKDQGAGLIHRIGDSAQAADIKQLNDAGVAMEGIKKETGTSRENWDEYRARLLSEYGTPQKLTGKPRIFISSRLVAIDPKTNEPFNFAVRELERLRWEEKKDANGVVQQPVWGKQPKHFIDALSYIIARIRQPVDYAEDDGLSAYAHQAFS